MHKVKEMQSKYPNLHVDAVIIKSVLIRLALDYFFLVFFMLGRVASSQGKKERKKNKADANANAKLKSISFVLDLFFVS